MRKVIFIFMACAMTSCVNQMERLSDAQKKYPKCVVQPTTSLFARQGYEILIEDTIAKQMYVLMYYPFSTTKIAEIRNVK